MMEIICGEKRMFEEKNARNFFGSAVDILSNQFKDYLSGYSDAVFFRGERRILGVSGLPFFAPCAIYFCNDRRIHDFVSALGDGCLFCFSGPVFRDGRFVFGKPACYTEAGKVQLPEDVTVAAENAINRFFSSIGWLDAEGRQHIDLKGYTVGPHYAVNLLLGDRTDFDYPLFTTPKSAVDAFGRGSFRSGGAQQVLATRYVVFPEENGEPANRQFYIFRDGKQIFYSLDVKNAVRAECIHSPNRSEMIYETQGGLKIRREIFLLPQKKGLPIAVEVQRLRLEQQDAPADLKVVFTGVFGICSPETIVNDVLYANVVNQSQITYRDGLPVAYALENKDRALRGEKKFFVLMADGKAGFDDFCCDRSEFIGSGTLAEPENAAVMSSRPARKCAEFFAVGKYIAAGKKTAELVTFTGICENPGVEDYEVGPDYEMQLENLLELFSAAGSLDAVLEENERKYKEYTKYLRLEGEGLGAYVSNNLPFQVLYQTFVSRSFGWTQKAYRETGFREIQDIYASMNYLVACGKSALAKKLVSGWAENVFEMGFAWHDFTWQGKGAGVCSDDQLWLVPAVYRYVVLTGDYRFLDEKFAVAGSKKRRSLWETLRAILLYSGKISVGKHGLPLFDKADWNDTLRLDRQVLDGPSKQEAYAKQLKQSGAPYGVPYINSLTESTMNACLLKIAADLTEKLAKQAGRDELTELAREISENTAKAMREHCWKGNFYARAMINDGREGGYTYLGAKGDGLSLDPEEDGTYYLNSYSWTILSGIADEDQTAEMLEVVERHLKADAGLKLCTLVDYGRLGANTATDLYYAGDRENGGVFKHAAMMAAKASLVAAKRVRDSALANRLADMAAFAIGKTLPYKTLENPFVIKGNPRFCTQYNNSVTGENIGPILSGTASWLTLCVYELLGISDVAEEVVFDPVIPRGWEGYRYMLRTGGTEISVRVCGGLRRTERSRCLVDGNATGRFAVRKDGGRHQIEIVL